MNNKGSPVFNISLAMLSNPHDLPFFKLRKHFIISSFVIVKSSLQKEGPDFDCFKFSSISLALLQI